MGFLSNLLNLDSWQLVNLDTGETVQGQFHAEDLTENISAKYETHTTLGRQNPTLQFINGDPHTITFKARLFSHVRPLGGENLSDLGVDPRGLRPGQTSPVERGQTLKEKLTVLKKWVRVDKEKGRPPVLAFYIGDGTEISMETCVITSLGGISYGRPKMDGSMRDLSLSINLLEYYDHELAEDETETRYHNVAEGDYYEMLTLREYGDPYIGDVIRKRHPTQPTLSVGDTVKLPSQPAIQSDKVRQTSVALKDGWGKKDSPQKRLRQQVLENRNVPYVSHIITED